MNNKGLVGELVVPFAGKTKGLEPCPTRGPRRTPAARPTQLAAALKPYDVETIQVYGKTDDGRPANRRGVVRADIIAAAERFRADDCWTAGLPLGDACRACDIVRLGHGRLTRIAPHRDVALARNRILDGRRSVYR